MTYQTTIYNNNNINYICNKLIGLCSDLISLISRSTDSDQVSELYVKTCFNLIYLYEHKIDAMQK